jgi:hypothetical protein
MKINTQWCRHVEAWRESGLNQANYCRQQGLNPKTFSTWARRALPIDKNTAGCRFRSSDAITTPGQSRYSTPLTTEIW